MVEAGRRPDPRGDDPRGARARARRDPQDLRGARGSARAGRQAEVGRSRAHRRARGDARRRRSQPRSPRSGSARPAASVDELVESLAPEVSMSSTEEDMTKRAQVRASFAAILEKARLAAVEAPLREQFLAELRELTDAEQDSKELKSAKRELLFDRILEEIQLPFPVGLAPAEGEAAGQGLGHAPVRQARVRGGLQGPRPQEDRRRQAPPGRPYGRGDPADLLRGHREPAHARLRALHARPDADHDAC